MMREKKLNRSIIFVIVAGIHLLVLFLVVFTMETTNGEEEPPLVVMKLADFDEEEPPPPPPPEVPVQTQTDPVAENIIATEIAPVTVTTSVASVASSISSDDNYLPQNKISVLPRLNEKDITNKLQYPEIAKRSNIEGSVILELFINKQGLVTNVRVLKETPEGMGFGDASIKAFTGLRAEPAQVSVTDSAGNKTQQAVGVRYRYPVRFQLH
jgi:protein TonB